MKRKNEPFAELAEPYADLTPDLEVAPRLVAVASRLRANCAALDISFEDLVTDLIEMALFRIDGELALRGIKGDAQ
jgi:class 3 adenylate cyclase